MSWYYAARYNEEHEMWYVHEVYGNGVCYAEEPEVPSAETLDDLLETLELMVSDIKQQKKKEKDDS